MDQVSGFSILVLHFKYMGTWNEISIGEGFYTQYVCFTCSAKILITALVIFKEYVITTHLESNSGAKTVAW